MLLELAKPVLFLAVVLSLLTLFHAAFLEPALTPRQHLEDALGPLVLSATLALAGGFAFLPPRRARVVPISRPRALLASFPVRVFCWSTAGMAVLFLAAWYVETYFLPYRTLPWR